MEQIFEGGCACGKTRYQVIKKPMFVHCCHCHLCQQQTGSAFILHAFLEPENIKDHQILSKEYVDVKTFITFTNKIENLLKN